MTVLARKYACELLSEILQHKRPFDEAISRHEFLSELAPRDRNFTRLMVLTTLRRLGQIDAIAAKFLQKPLQGKSQTVMNCLRLGICQLIWLETPPHAAVNETVEVLAGFGHDNMKGLLNAVLKKVAKEGKAIVATQDEGKINLPAWLYDSWQATYGTQTADAIAKERLKMPPLDVSVKSDPEGWANKLGGVLLASGSIRIEDAGKVDDLPGYEQGEWWVQDAASALPILSLGDIKDKVVFDLCAAPGGKTAALVNLGGDVFAVDKSKRRLQILDSNLERLNLHAELIEGDILKLKPEFKADIILLDAPCSATGTLRRHPELVWQRKQEDVAELAELQKKLLNKVSHWLKPQGKILYCTCSLQKEEGELQIEKFLENHQDFKLLPMQNIPKEFISEQGYLRTTPAMLAEQGGIDGFFAALMQKI